jgi:hypothetical protein
MSSDSVITTTDRQPLWLHGLAATVVAAGATMGGAALASAAGVSFADKTGASIPVSGFGTLTVAFSLIGVLLAAVLARKARHPRQTFVRTTVTLVVLSFIPDLLPQIGFDRVSAFTLMGLHVLAAVIVIPTLARRLAQG